MLCIYADYKSDESYTPSKISVRVGNNFHNLQEIRVTTLCDVIIVIKAQTSTDALSFSSTQMVFFLLNVFLLCFLPKAIGDGGAKRLDSYLSVESGKTFIIISINLSTFFGTNY